MAETTYSFIVIVTCDEESKKVDEYIVAQDLKRGLREYDSIYPVQVKAEKIGVYTE